MATARTKNKEVAAPTAAGPAVPEAQRRPLQTVRVGDCSASIWSRDHLVRGERRTFYSVTLERSYRDRNGAYRYTKSFDPDSLGALVSALQRADEYLHGLQEATAP
jgi:hypothetical protein